MLRRYEVRPCSCSHLATCARPSRSCPADGLNSARRLRMALDVARGLHYLHSCRPAIVHRDLKSPNLLVDRDWTVSA